MRKPLVFVLAIVWMTQIVSAQFGFLIDQAPPDEATPTFTIYPEDVIQDSITRFRMGGGKFTVRWQFTEAGGKKLLTFRKSNTGKRVRTRVGDYESPPAVSWPRTVGTTNNVIPWEKMRTDKVIGVSESDADKIVAGLKKK